MAEFTGSTFSGTSQDSAATPPYAKVHGSRSRAKLRSTIEVITMASQASGSTFPVAIMPEGAGYAGHRVTVSASTGSATLAIGVSGSAAKYKAAAALTTTDTPTTYGLASAMGQAPLTAEERVILTTGGAALPSSGTLVIETFWREPA